MLDRFAKGRPFWSYSKLQKLRSALIRNRAWQLRRPRIRNLQYLDIGCGPNTHSNFINLDYMWLPGVDVCWDISSGLPFGDNQMLGMFSEHCLEHFPLKSSAALLRECFRVLRPGGTIRIIVPDAELYLSAYANRNSSAYAMPFDGNVSFDGMKSPILDVNRIFYQDRESIAGHWFIYDAEFLAKLLGSIGFASIQKVEFAVGRDRELLVDTPSRQVESLYMEATKPS